MTRLRLACRIVALSGCALTWSPVASAQNPASPAAQLKVRFRQFDINEDGWLSGRELAACRCRAADRDGDNEVTWTEYADAARLADTGPAAPAPATRAAPAPAAAAPTSYEIGQLVELYADGGWVRATIVERRDGRYRLSRHDYALGVTTSEEWIGPERLRPAAARPPVPSTPARALPTAVPTGEYACSTYNTNMALGKLRILGPDLSSELTRDGSGRHRFRYDPADGTLRWDGGLTILGWTVELAEYRPQTDGTPNINLHYRREAGAHLQSIYCTRR